MSNTNIVHPNRRAGAVIVQHNKELFAHRWWLFPLGFIMIYSFIIPTLFVDILILFYQNTYFSTFKIPHIHRSQYVIIDRGKLSILNPLEKLNCAYCAYVNGVIAYAKAVAAQTEIYSCAIKHKVQPIGQNHQEEFYDYQLFEK